MSEENNEDLRKLAEQFILEENTGDRAFFELRLAPMFVLRRANGEFNSLEMFLAGLKPAGERVLDPKSIAIQPLGKTRALVTFVVTVGIKVIHNALVFVRNPGGQWQLVSWVNESA